MSTLNLGKLRFNWRGVYSPANLYTRNDTVKYEQNTYVCIAEAAAGAFDPDHWALMAEGMHPATAEGDLITFENGNLVRKPIGEESAVLTVENGKPVWGSGKGGQVLVNRVYQKGSSGIYGLSTGYAWIPDLWIDYAPLRSDTKIRFKLDFAAALNGGSGMICHTILHMGGTEYGRFGMSANTGEQKANVEVEAPSWGAGNPQRCGLFARAYSTSWPVRFHGTYYWDGTTGGHFYPPTLIIEEFKDS